MSEFSNGVVLVAFGTNFTPEPDRIDRISRAIKMMPDLGFVIGISDKTRSE
jgi:hypothetical protein